MFICFVFKSARCSSRVLIAADAVWLSVTKGECLWPGCLPAPETGQPDPENSTSEPVCLCDTPQTQTQLTTRRGSIEKARLQGS